MVIFFLINREFEIFSFFSFFFCFRKSDNWKCGHIVTYELTSQKLMLNCHFKGVMAAVKSVCKLILIHPIDFYGVWMAWRNLLQTPFSVWTEPKYHDNYSLASDLISNLIIWSCEKVSSGKFFLSFYGKSFKVVFYTLPSHCSWETKVFPLQLSAPSNIFDEVQYLLQRIHRPPYLWVWCEKKCNDIQQLVHWIVSGVELNTEENIAAQANE